MSQDVAKHPSLTERLSEIDRLLAAPAAGAIDWPRLRAQFTAVDESLRDLGDAESRECAVLLSRLAEFGDCTLAGADDLTADAEELLTALKTGDQVLLAKLENKRGGDQKLVDFLRNANERWADSLTLLDDGPADLAADSWFDSEFEDFNGEAEHSNGETAELEPAADQVSLLLQALASGEVEVEDCDPGQTPFGSDADDVGAALTPGGVPIPPVPTRIDMNPELLEAYLDDANNGLATLEQAVLQLESNPGNREPLQQICRELHTLKGASASVGLSELASYLHAVEDSVQAQSDKREGGVDVESILASVDAVREQIEALTGKTPANSAPESSGETSKPGESKPASAPAPAFSPGVDGGSTGRDETVRVKASQLDRLMDMLAELVMLRNRRETRVEELKSANGELIRCAARIRGTGEDVLPNHVENTGPVEATDFDRNAGSQRTRYFAEIANDLTEISRGIRDLYKPVSAENQAVSRFIRQFRQELMQLRRLPVAGLFQRLQRSVRDAARVEGKQVRLELVGEHSGLERSLQERIYEPLLHLVRNAVSHGIETAEQRQAAGKEPTGTITLEAHGGPNLLILEVRDDGRGLDYDAIRRRGIERGLLSVDRQPSRNELAQLIFHPGFSTRDETSEISGRGVGMDVVAATLDKLHARIDVESETGKGMTIRLTIPLHSVIEHTMVVRVSGQLFALPTQFVRSVGHVKPADTDHATGDADGDLNGQAGSIHLGRLLGLPRSARRTPRGNVQIGRSSSEQCVLQVDEVVGPEEVVVRSLPTMLRWHRMFAGVTLSGAGETVLLFDGQRLLELAKSAAKSTAESDAVNEGPRDLDATPRNSMRALVVDDSLSARRSLVLKLRDRGEWQFTEAADGAEALDRLRVQSFDVVFTDLEMPRMGGLELLEEIKSGRQFEGMPVVVVTSRGEQEYRDRADELDTDGYLTKPINEIALEEVLSNLNLVERGSLNRLTETTEISQ